MARINLGSMINWVNGQKVTAELVKQDREVLVTAINDNYNRIADLEQATEITVPLEASWEATSNNQIQFTLTSGTFPDIPNILEVSAEGFVLTEGEEFTVLSDNMTIELSSGVDIGTRIYARWYEVRSLKLFTNDLAIYNIMGVF